MRSSLVVILCACFFSAPAHAGEPGSVGQRILRAPTRALSKRLVKAKRAFRYWKAEKRARNNAAAEMKKLIREHGHETVTYKGEAMPLRQAYEFAQRANSVDLIRFSRNVGRALVATFLTLAALAEVQGMSPSLEATSPILLLGAGFFGVFTHDTATDLKPSSHAARRETLQAAHNSGKRLPATLSAYYGVVK